MPRACPFSGAIPCLPCLPAGEGSSLDLIADIASECFIPFAYGGGIKTLDDIREIFRHGVEKVVINTYAVENPHFIREAAGEFGSQSIVVSIDVNTLGEALETMRFDLLNLSP